jgi:hypothetical protein
MECPRCESVGRKPQKATINVIGPNGAKMKICQTCYDEVIEEQGGREYFIHENEEE